MDFIQKSFRIISLEEAVCFLRRYPFTPVNVRKCLPIVEVVPIGPDVTYPMAVDVWSAAGRAAVAESRHPSVQLKTLLTVAPVVITSDRVEQITYECVKKLEVRCAFVVPVESDAKVIERAYVSEVLPYVYTPAMRKNDSSIGVVESNFTEVSTDVENSVPVIPAPIVEPEGWSGSSAEYNRDSVYTATAEPAQLAACNQIIVENIIQSVKKLSSLESDLSDYAKKVIDQSDSCVADLPLVPPFIERTSIRRAYELLYYHRLKRGEDKTWIAAMSTGYYWGSVTPAVSKVMGLVSDILHVLRDRNLTAVFFPEEPLPAVMWSLVWNRYPVYVLSSRVNDEIIYEMKNDRRLLVPEVYRVRRKPELVVLTVMSDLVFHAPRYKGRQMLYPGRKLSEQKICDMIQGAGHPILVRSYLADDLFRDNYCNGSLTMMPSTSPHSGRVMLVSKLAEDKRVAKRLWVNRMVDSIVIKTWFPITRYRMIDFDYQSGWRNKAYDKGMIIVSTNNRKMKSYSYCVDGDTWGVEYQDKLRALLGVLPAEIEVMSGGVEKDGWV